MKPVWRALGIWLAMACAQAAEVKWTNLSSERGELPVPGESTQQTGNLVADLDGNGVKDFVLSFRAKPPALVWYRRANSTWGAWPT